MNNWEGIEEFIATIETGSFSAAGKRLNVSTSHVSRQVTALEKRLGVQLIKRTTRKMNLTESGQQYYRQCSELCNALKEANETLQGGLSKPKGLIRITAAGRFVEKKIVPLLADYMLMYPEVEVHVDFNSQYVDMIEDGYDLAIRYGYLKDSSLIARKLTGRTLSICGSPSYLAKHGAPKTPDDLKKHNCLVGNTQHWRLQFPDGVRDIRIDGTWKSNAGEALVEAAVKGIGLVYISEFYTKEYLDQGELVRVMDDFAVKDMGTWLVYPNREFLPTKVRLLVELLTNHFANTEEKS